MYELAQIIPDEKSFACPGAGGIGDEDSVRVAEAELSAQHVHADQSQQRVVAHATTVLTPLNRRSVWC